MAAFDPWATLAEIRERDQARSASDAISRVSHFSRGAPPEAENENPPPPRFDWPDGPDYWLTRHGGTLAGILSMGGTARFCSNGGVDAWDAAGLYRGFSPDLVRRLRGAGLLPDCLRGVIG